MQINVDQKMLDLQGEEIMRRLPPREGKKPEKPKPLTLKTVCVDALLANYPNEQLTGEEKLARYKLAQLIDKGGMVGLSSDKITLLKTVIGKLWGTLISGQAWLMLEQEIEKQKVQTKKKKDKKEKEGD